MSVQKIRINKKILQVFKCFLATFFFGLYFLVCAYQTLANTKDMATKATLISADILAKNLLIVDTHIDVPFRLEIFYEDITGTTKKGQFDYPRAKIGGLNVPFMSIYIPATKQNSDEAGILANRLIDRVEAMVGRAPDKFALAATTSQVRKNFQKGLISLAMGMENGAPIAGDLENLQHFYRRGIRYITLTHSKPNHISDSSYDEVRPWQGLSPFGKKLILAMNKIGMMIDVSHISDQAFWQVMELSDAPVIASHSSVRHFTPGFERNMSDDMIKVLAAKGGVIQINIGSAFLTEKAMNWNAEFKNARSKFIKQSDSLASSEIFRNFTAQYFADHPYPYADLDDVLNHIDHVVALVGVESVGIGSDFDGVGDTLPVGFKDVSQYPNVVQGLLDRGYKEADVTKILGGNLMRVWTEVEDYAVIQLVVSQ